MKCAKFLLISLLLMMAPLASGQEAIEDVEIEATEPDTTEAEPGTYSGDWLSWPKMTGDWGGARTELENMGIKIDIDYTQIFQGNAGGKDDDHRFSGLGEMEMTLDLGKMGLIPGGAIILKADAPWGSGIQSSVGSLSPVDLNVALPGSAEPGFGLDEGARVHLSEFFYQQALFVDPNKPGPPPLILLAGKLWGARAFDANAFANSHQRQFMNAALRNTIMIPSFLPYTTMGLGVIVNPTPWLSIMSAVADTDGRAKTTGFETAFHGDTNTTVIHEWSFKINPFELPGTQRIGFVWSSKDFDLLRPNEPFGSTGDLAISLLGLDLAQRVVDTFATFDDGGDNIMVYYNFDQYLYTEEADPSQGIGLFGRFAWARENVNPVNTFWSCGVGGKGIIPERDNDTFGLGWYYFNLSNDLPSVFNHETGFELYYSIEIAPWLHISPDLQVICDPGGNSLGDELAIVYGLRMHMNL